MSEPSTLEDRIKATIAHDGPMDLATYMRFCLTDPAGGYYTTQKPFGAAGDFITAPEVSQLFGELIGIWVIDIWQKLGAPEDLTLVEAGPGRGTLMADMLRVIEKAAPAFCKTLNIHLIEASDRLKEQQRTALAGSNIPVQWSKTLEGLDGHGPDRPIILIANEFLDALPIRQFQFMGDRWFERMVGLDGDNVLTFGLEPTEFAPPAKATAEGAIFEICPLAHDVVRRLCQRISKTPGAVLFIDYGHLKSGYGDTFQAIKNHTYANPLEAPGSADLTAHVDFEALANIAEHESLKASATTQGAFLLALGLLERAGALGSTLDAKNQESIRDAVGRLAAPDQMGDLFKVLAITPQEITPHGF